MTLEQKQAIEALRLQGIGYVSVATRLGLSVNTVKSYCRRNSLSTTVLSGGILIKKGRPKLSDDCAAKKDKAPTECEVTLSYKESPDTRAVTDVMMTLMNIQMR